MINLHIWLILCLSNFGRILAKTGLNSKTDWKIVGGYPCQIQEHPYMVSIRYAHQDVHFCGGTLISARWVLTAAHCANIKNTSVVLKVLAGSTNADKPDTKNAQMSIVKAIHIHPDYDIHGLANDIAVLQLANRMERTNYVNFANLATYLHLLDRQLEEICTNATVVGWGFKHAKPRHFNSLSTPVRTNDPNLHCTHLAVLSPQECKERHGDKKLPGKVFCAIAPNTGPCYGDSGGPLICRGVQFGITSLEVGCANPQYPGIYTQVDQYRDFLFATIARSSCGTLCLFRFTYFVCIVLTHMCNNLLLLK